MKKWLLFLAIAIAASLFLYFQMMAKNSPAMGVFSSKAPLLSGLPAARPVIRQPGGRTPREVAQNFIDAHREEWKIQPHHELVPEISRFPLGSRVHYQVLQDGIPVVGMGIDVRMDSSLQVVEVQNEYRPLEKADVKGSQLPVGEILKEASQHYAYQPDTNAESAASSNQILFVSEAMTTPELAVVIPLVKGTQSYQVVFRASDGQFLGRSKSRSEF